MKADPKMVKIGRGKDAYFICALDGCEEELNDVTVKNDDPFHSVDCARSFHDAPLTPTPRQAASQRTSERERETV